MTIQIGPLLSWCARSALPLREFEVHDQRERPLTATGGDESSGAGATAMRQEEEHEAQLGRPLLPGERSGAGPLSAVSPVASFWALPQPRRPSAGGGRRSDLATVTARDPIRASRFRVDRKQHRAMR
jgi:hypothetical protein